jgi:hypothetical protein
MKFPTPSLIFFVISPVLASLAMSPRSNALERRTGECYVVSLQFPSSIDHPCGDGYVVGNCNCCPNGQIGCLSPAVCTIGSAGNYFCEIPSGSGTGQCAAGEKICGPKCIPDEADCCGTGQSYCPAPLHCSINALGSNACFTSTQAAATAPVPPSEASTSVQAVTTAAMSTTNIFTDAGGGQTSFPSASIPPSSETATAAGSTAIASGTTAGSSALASQTQGSLGNSIRKSYWSVGSAFVMLGMILFLI